MHIKITKNKYDANFSRSSDEGMSFNANLAMGANTDGTYYCTIGINDWSKNSQTSEHTTYSEAEYVLEYGLFNKIGFVQVSNCTFQCTLPCEMSLSQTLGYLTSASQRYNWTIERDY